MIFVQMSHEEYKKYSETNQLLSQLTKALENERLSNEIKVNVSFMLNSRLYPSVGYKLEKTQTSLEIKIPQGIQDLLVKEIQILEDKNQKLVEEVKMYKKMNFIQKVKFLFL
jgi:hypothetical protein